MNYNIHPLFVHFPIAFLFVYSIVKIIPFKRWFPNVSWRQIERLLLVVGVGGAFLALYTGGIAEDLVRPNHQLVDAHSTFAATSTWIYGALLLGELAAFVNSFSSARQKMGSALESISSWIEKIFCSPVFSALLALAGLVCISLTGLLGGVIAYGAVADPAAPLVLKILGISY